MRQNARRKTMNDARKKAYKEAVKIFKKTPTNEALSLAYKKLDKAAKALTIHPNRAARLKSRLTHRIAKLSKATS